MSKTAEPIDGSTAQRHITGGSEIAALAALGTIGNFVAYILPVNIGAVVDSLHVDARVAGYLGTCELVGLTLGSALFSRAILVLSWRAFARAAIVIAVASNLLTPLLSALPLLFVFRLLSGVGGGMLLSVAAAGLSSTRRPESVIGASTIASMIFSAFALYELPLLLASLGTHWLFYIVAILNIALLVPCQLIPRCSPYAAAGVQREGSPMAMRAEVQARPPRWLTTATLTGVFFFFAGAMAFWVYFERVGVAGHIGVGALAQVLGGSQLAGAVGAIAAVALGMLKVPRLPPMMLALLLASGAALTMALPLKPFSYGASAFAFMFAWSLSYPYMMEIGRAHV